LALFFLSFTGSGFACGYTVWDHVSVSTFFHTSLHIALPTRTLFCHYFFFGFFFSALKSAPVILCIGAAVIAIFICLDDSFDFVCFGIICISLSFWLCFLVV